jgi:hypothetical protein
VTAITSGCAGSDSEIEAADKPNYVQPIPKATGATTASSADALVNVVAYHWKSHTVLDEVAVVLEDSTGNQSSEKGFTSRILPVGSYQVSVSPPGSSNSREAAIDLKDALATLKLAIGIESINGTDTSGKPFEVSAYQRAAADFNSDGRIDLKDALEILKYSIGVSNISSARWLYYLDKEGIAPGNPPRAELTVARRATSVGDNTSIGVVGVLTGDVDGSWRPMRTTPEVALSYFTDLVTTLLSADRFANLARWGITNSVDPDNKTIVAKTYQDGVETITFSDGSQIKLPATTILPTYSAGGVFQGFTFFFADRDNGNGNPRTYILSGVVSGLDIGNAVTLANGSETLTIKTNSVFSLNTPITPGKPYNVTVVVQPNGQSCSVTNGSGVAISPIDNVSINCGSPSSFALIPDAFSIVYPENTNSAFTVAAADVNSDGKDDLIVHYIGNKFWGQSVGNITAPNAVRIYIQKPDGKFEDQTKVYLTGPDDLGGWSRKFKIVDINNDGKRDMVFAVNQEDGRAQSIGSDMNAQMAGLVSTGNSYRIVKFGTPSWYESVGVGYDSNGRPFVSGNGHTANNTKSFFIDKSGTVSDTDLKLPMLSQVAFEFMNTTGEQAASNSIIQPIDADYWNGLYMQGFLKQSDGSWSTLPTLTSLADKIGTATYVGYTGDSSQVSIWATDGTYFTGGYVDSCQIRLGNSGLKIAIFAIGGTPIQNYVPGMIVDSTKLTSVFHALKGVTIQNGRLVEIALNIKNQKQLNVNSNFMDCTDVNGDGYEDIVVYRYNTPDNAEYIQVYLGDKDGGFNYADKIQFPGFSSASLAAGWTSYLHDFDNDGIPDLLIYP